MKDPTDAVAVMGAAWMDCVRSTSELLKVASARYTLKDADAVQSAVGNAFDGLVQAERMNFIKALSIEKVVVDARCANSHPVIGERPQGNSAARQWVAAHRVLVRLEEVAPLVLENPGGRWGVPGNRSFTLFCNRQLVACLNRMETHQAAVHAHRVRGAMRSDWKTGSLIDPTPGHVAVLGAPSVDSPALLEMWASVVLAFDEYASRQGVPAAQHVCSRGPLDLRNASPASTALSNQVAAYRLITRMFERVSGIESGVLAGRSTLELGSLAEAARASSGQATGHFN